MCYICIVKQLNIKVMLQYYHFCSQLSSLHYRLSKFVLEKLSSNESMRSSFLDFLSKCQVSFYWTKRHGCPRYRLVNNSSFAEDSDEYVHIESVCSCVNDILYTSFYFYPFAKVGR